LSDLTANIIIFASLGTAFLVFYLLSKKKN